MPILAAALALAAAAPAAAATTALDRAVADYDSAQVHGDRRALQRLLANDYVLANSGGGVETKAEFIADLTDPGYHLNPYVVLHPVERTWAGGALRGGLARLTGTAAGKPFDICLRFIDVWRREGVTWRVAYSQAMRAPGACDAR
jgi:ketosteroid isomerase-like protein